MVLAEAGRRSHRARRLLQEGHEHVGCRAWLQLALEHDAVGRLRGRDVCRDGERGERRAWLRLGLGLGLGLG